MNFNESSILTEDNVYYELYLDNPNFSGAIVALELTLIFFLFVGMSTVSNYFLCPTLASICKRMGLSESVAGVTIMAVANGSNDVFSCLRAVLSNKGSLAISSVVGASCLCTTFVAGLVIVLRPIPRLASRPLLRDFLFLALSYFVVYLVLRDGIIYWYESMVFLLLYFVYALIVVIGRKIYIAQSREREEYAHVHDGSSTASEETDNNLSIAAHRHEEDEHQVFYDCVSSGQIHEKDVDLERQVVSVEPTSLPSNTFFLINGEKDTRQMLRNDHSNNVREKNTSWCFNFLQWSFPPLADFESLGIIGKAYGIFQVPWYFALIMTVPFFGEFLNLSEESDESVSFRNESAPPIFDEYLLDRLLQIRCFWSLFSFPIVILLLLGPDSFISNYFTIVILVSLGLTALGLIFSLFTGHHKGISYSYFMVPCLLCSVAWLYFLAGHLIMILSSISEITGIGRTILGSVLLAFGNSIGDLISNVSMAKLGYSRMAFSACFGSALVSNLFGLGLSTFVFLLVNQSGSFLFAPNINQFSLHSMMICTLCTLGLFTLASYNLNWAGSRWLGAILITGYLTIIAVQISLATTSSN